MQAKKYAKYLKMDFYDIQIDIPQYKQEEMLNELKPRKRKEIEKYLKDQRKLASQEAIVQCKTGITAIIFKDEKWYI